MTSFVHLPYCLTPNILERIWEGARAEVCQWLFVLWKEHLSHLGCGSCFSMNYLDYEPSLSSY